MLLVLVLSLFLANVDATNVVTTAAAVVATVIAFWRRRDELTADDKAKLWKRLDELETRLAQKDQVIDELRGKLAERDLTIVKLETRIKNLETGEHAPHRVQT